MEVNKDTLVAWLKTLQGKWSADLRDMVKGRDAESFDAHRLYAMLSGGIDEGAVADLLALAAAQFPEYVKKMQQESVIADCEFSDPPTIADKYVCYGHNRGEDAACGGRPGSAVLPHGKLRLGQTLSPGTEWCPDCLGLCGLKNPPPKVGTSVDLGTCSGRVSNAEIAKANPPRPGTLVNVTTLQVAADRAFRFFGGLSFTDATAKVQREVVEVVRELGRALRPENYRSDEDAEKERKKFLHEIPEAARGVWK